MIKRRKLSLTTQTLLMLALGLALALAVYFALDALVEWGIETVYLSDDAVRERNRALCRRLQDYVTENDVGSTDYDALETWMEREGYAALIVYESDRVYEGGAWGYELLSPAQMEDQDPAEWGYTTFYVAFSNGTRRVAIGDSSDLKLYDTAGDIVLVVGFLTFMTVQLAYTLRVTRDIRALSREVTAVRGGATQSLEEGRGFLELSALAHDVNRMHDDITERTRSAQDALQKNSDLITALSHDIRNPLTSLIGYLTLLEMDAAALTDTQRQYLASCMEKAMRIRDLSDEMFRYFLIFSDKTPPLHLERYDLQILAEQLFGEYYLEMETCGFHFQLESARTPCFVETDIQMLRRVIENLASNLRKYADPNVPVLLRTTLVDGVARTTIQNGVRSAAPDSVERNHVGLRTCEAIMQLLGGSFAARAENGRFTVEFSLPVAEA